MGEHLNIRICFRKTDRDRLAPLWTTKAPDHEEEEGVGAVRAEWTEAGREVMDIIVRRAKAGIILEGETTGGLRSDEAFCGDGGRFWSHRIGRDGNLVVRYVNGNIVRSDIESAKRFERAQLCALDHIYKEAPRTSKQPKQERDLAAFRQDVLYAWRTVFGLEPELSTEPNPAYEDGGWCLVIDNLMTIWARQDDWELGMTTGDGYAEVAWAADPYGLIERMFHEVTRQRIETALECVMRSLD